jgi:transposase
MFSSLNEANAALEQKDLQIQELTKKLQSTQLSMKMLQHQVEQLIRRVYGKRSEKIDPKQMMFDNFIMDALDQPQSETLPETLPEQKEKPKKKPRAAKRNHPGRIPIPEHLERVEIVLDVPEGEKICPETGKPLKKIGEEVSEKLEYKPGKLIVNVYKRPKYGSPDSMASGEVGVITAPMPDHPIEKCKADVGLISHIIVSKFADHLPLYRQDGIFEREGVTIPRSTQTNWTLQTYEAISPLENALKEAVFDSNILFTDDSIIPLQIKGNGRVKKGRLWVYVRGGPGPPLCVFDFSQDRSKKRPISTRMPIADMMNSFKKKASSRLLAGYMPDVSSMRQHLPVRRKQQRS